MGKVDDFKKEFEERAREIEGVNKVEWMGSIADSFRQGRSDLDLIIWGDVAAKDKEKISDMIKELNYKHSLGLETAPYQHPTPFFVDNPAKRVAYDVLVPKGGLVAFTGIRKIWKHHAPTYGQVWGLEGKVERRAPRLFRFVRRVYHEIL